MSQGIARNERGLATGSEFWTQSSPTVALGASGRIEILPAVDRDGRRRFVEFPWSLYEHDANWVPPIIDQELQSLEPGGVFFEHARGVLLVAERDGKAVGRIGAFVDHASSEPQVGTIGYFEAVNDETVAKALFESAESWLQHCGCTRARGPMSPSIIIGTLGLLVEGEGMPPIMAPHNPSYYPALFSACGYRKDVDLLFYRSDPAAADPLEGQKLFRKCEEAGISFRCLDKRRLDEEMFRYVELHNRAYAHSQHYAHASATRREASFLGEAFKQIIEPEMIVFAERAGKTIGTCVAMPDAGPVLRALDGKPSMVRLLKALMAKHRLDGVRVADLAVDPAEQKSHVGLAMIHFVLQAAVRCGYKRAELGWVVENNIASMRCVELVKGRLVRRYRMYQKELSVA